MKEQGMNPALVRGAPSRYLGDSAQLALAAFQQCRIFVSFPVLAAPGRRI
jgi:hypothetical protein